MTTNLLSSNSKNDLIIKTFLSIFSIKKYIKFYVMITCIHFKPNIIKPYLAYNITLETGVQQIVVFKESS